MGERKKRYYYILAFVLPVAAGLLMFAVKNIYPFGDQCVLNLDLWGQYFPMYVQHSEVSSISEAIYSHNGALGYNNWAQDAYYCGSIFLWLLRLVPLDKMVACLDYICLLKLGLCGLSCLFFLDYKIGKRMPVLLGGAVSYSLCGYALAFMTQPMWTDAMIYAPLILLNLERLIKEKKSIAYSLILALCIVSNFYIGYQVCLFTACYFLCIVFSLPGSGEKGLRGCLKSRAGYFRRFIFYSILAGMLSAIVVIPTYAALQNTISTKASPTAIEWYSSWKDLFALFLPGQGLKLDFEGVNVYTGLIPLISLPVYFFCRRIPRKERILYGLFLVFLVLSTNCNVLDYIWHGFRFPNHYPGRWTFLLSLLLVVICCQGLAQWEWKRTSLVTAGIWAAALFMISDSSVNFIRTADMEDGGLATSNITGYTEALVRHYENGNSIASGADDFYRVEANSGFTFNSSMIGNYHGISYYSSTMSGGVYQLLRYLGNRVYSDSRSTVYSLSSIVQNSLFGIRYYLDYNRNLLSVLPTAQLESEKEQLDVWSNSTALPLAYGVSEEILDLEITDEIRAIENQNDFLNRLCGQEIDVFEKIETTAFSYGNCTLSESENWNSNYYFTEDLDQPVTMQYVFEIKEDGPVYLEHNYRAGSMTARYRDTETELTVSGQPFSYLGEFSAGETITIDFTAENIGIGCTGLNLYRLDLTNWQQAYEILSSQEIEIDHFENTAISGTITMKEDGLVMATLAQDGGWSVTCDGEPAETELIGGALIGIYVPAGTHQLEFTYRLPGGTLGCCLSLAGLLLLIGTFFAGKYRRVTTISGTVTMKEDGCVLLILVQDGGWHAACDGEPVEMEQIGRTLTGIRVSAGTHQLELTYRLSRLRPGYFLSLIVLFALDGGAFSVRRRWLKNQGESGNLL